MKDLISAIYKRWKKRSEEVNMSKKFDELKEMLSDFGSLKEEKKTNPLVIVLAVIGAVAAVAAIAYAVFYFFIPEDSEYFEDFDEMDYEDDEEEDLEGDE